MKFIIQQVHSEQIEIDIPQDTTLAQLRELLISQYSYPDQQMKFINNGIILKDPGALMNVKELGRIIVFIKNKDSKKSHKRSQKAKKEENNSPVQEKDSNIEAKPETEIVQQEPKPENTNKDQINENSNPVIESKAPDAVATVKSNESNENTLPEPLELTNISSIPDSDPLFYPYPKNNYNDPQSLADIPKEQLDAYLADCFKKIHLKQLYDEKCNFYANLNETKRIADMIEHNPGLILVVSQFTKNNFTVAMQRNTIDFDFAMDLAGFVSTSPIQIADDYDAIYSEMPTIYTQIIKKLRKKYNKTQIETVKAFVDSQYDIEKAEKLLQS